MRVSLIDLDGTICDERHRNHLARQKKWDEYHSLCYLDDPMNTELLGPLVIVTTGRPMEYYPQTHRWFYTYALPLPLSFFMRASRAPAIDMKRSWATHIIKAGFGIELAADDRLDICEMYKDLGIPRVIHVDKEGRQHELN